MYRHKLRIGKSIERIEDVEEREELYNSLSELYLNYVALFGLPSVKVKKCEAEVKEEVKNIEYKSPVYGPGESPEEVSASTSTKWIKARVEMLLAQVLKKSYTHLVYAREELAMLEGDLNSLERKLFEEPDSQVKADIIEEIEKVRQLLLFLGE